MFTIFVFSLVVASLVGGAFDTARLASRYALPSWMNDVRQRRNVGFVLALAGGVYLRWYLHDLRLWQVAEVVVLVAAAEMALYLRWRRRARRLVQHLREGMREGRWVDFDGS